MVPKPALVRLSVGLLFAFFLFAWLRFVPTVSSRAVRLERDLDHHFVQHQSLQLDTRNVVQQVRETGRMSLATADLRFDLELVPHDVRAPGYRAEEFGADGVARPIDIGPVRTFKGRARGSQGGNPLPVAEARLTIDEQGIEGLIITPTEHYFVEPAQNFSDAALKSDYVLYRESDVVTRVTGACDVTLSDRVEQQYQSVGGDVVPVREMSLGPDQTRSVASTSEMKKKTRKAAIHSSRSSKGNCQIPAAAVSSAEPLSGHRLNRALTAGCTFSGGTNLKIQGESGAFTLPVTDPYCIYATSVLPNQTGDYSISFSSTTTKPSNDNFVDAQLITGIPGSVAGTTVGATKEKKEPNHADNQGGASIWYRWQPITGGHVTFETTESNFDTLLAVYTGDALGSLTTIVSNDDANGTSQSSVGFASTPGVVYYIAVDGFDGATGNVILSWNPTVFPANDAFANAQPISGFSGSASGNNTHATKEWGEPNHGGDAGGASVWYRWTAPATDRYEFETHDSSFDTLLGIYTGSNVSSLTTIESNDDFDSIQSRIILNAKVGTVYYIAVDGYFGDTGPFKLNWRLTPAPPNDDFANAQSIAGPFGSVVGTNLGAISELGEPHHSGTGAGASVWYRWQAPTDSAVTFTTSGSDFNTVLGVYTGSSVDSLTTIISNQSDPLGGPYSSVTFTPISETVYYIAVDSFLGTGALRLNWGAAAPFLELRMATEADNEYVLAKGGPASAVREILTSMNLVEGLYEAQLGLTFRIVYQSAWSTSNDPYTSTNPTALLGELANYWNANRGSVARDLVHMWTGKELDNSTIGTAYLESLCRFGVNGRAAYGLSKGVNGVQGVAIIAHEIGHNLGATHPNQQVPPVSDCESTVMSSSVSTNTQLLFCQYSVDEILKYLGANASCLTSETSQLSFGVLTTYAVGSVPNSIATSDFNGDGKLDLAVANILSHDVKVLLGTDFGTLKTGGLYPVGAEAYSVAVGDFNGDGKSDLVVAGGNNVSVLLGVGDGTFQKAMNHSVGDSLDSSAVGDFNRDGKLDVILADYGNNNVILMLGLGNGTLQASATFSTGMFPSSITTGDFNRDNKLDFAVTNRDSNTVTVRFGTGTGNFQSPVNYPVGNAPAGLATGDFNRDGNLDLAVANSNNGNSNANNNLSVLLGRSNGTFQAPINYAAGENPSAIAVADFNGDGKDDIAVDAVKILIGNGDGTFRSLVNYPVFNGSTSIVAGDFNGDSNQDLAVANGQNPTVTVLLGKGDGSFPTAPIHTVGADIPESIAVGDFNADGKQDLVVADSYSFSGPGGTVSILLGLGKGDFADSVSYAVGSVPTSVTVGDFNGDGKQDLATANARSNDVSVLLGTGTGTFQTAVNYAAGVSPMGIVVSDFNGDGKQDLATSNFGSNDVSVLLGTGTGGFLASSNYAVGIFPNSIVAGDFNNDGKTDLATPNFNSNNMSVLLGTGTGSFQAMINYAVGTSPVAIAVADFNGDKNQDLVVADNRDNDVSVLLGTSTGALQPAVKYSVGISPISVAVGDFNGDGKQDIVVPGFSILLGTGKGTFQVPIQFPLNSNFAAPGDFNNDGKLDLAFAVFRGVTIQLNTSEDLLATPLNDNFGAARVISGITGTLPGNSMLATKEAGEPNHADASGGTGGASIWYQWRAPSTGKFFFHSFGSSFLSVLGVYTGTKVDSLSKVVKSSSASPEYVEFNATAGTTYEIAIDGLTGDTGSTVLSWNTGSLSNDNFASAREIRGSSGSVNGDNTNFTLELNEPILPGPSATGFSAWYRWTAPNTGKVSFSTAPCGDTTRLLGAFTGNFIDILSPVAVNFDGYRDFDDPGACDNRSLRFNAVAGTTYRIQLRSVAGKPFTLSWSYANPPPNDNFANALILAGASGSLVGTNRDATKEPGEPNHAGGPGGASIWYRWTAPNSGPVTFDTIGFRNQTSNSFRYLTALMAVYTGSSLNSLISVVTNATDNKVTFNATAGTTYQIAIDSGPYTGGGYLPGLVPLHWGSKQVANDDFANAQPLTASGSFVPLLGSNAGATKETGEPNHAGSAGGTSVWYRWTALSTGNVSFVLQPCITCTLATGNALVAVYTGANVNALTAMPTTVDNNHTFTAVRGTTYFIAVDSNTSAGGSYQFSLISANISARNDAFANAQVLSGSAGAAAGDNSGASKEIAEPNHANDIGGASVWYQWKAPASGLFTFDTFGSNFDTLLAVYTGNVVSALSVVASSDNAGSSPQSRVTFDAKLNTTYFIAVDGKSNGVEQGTGLPRSQTGFILLNWNNLPPPVNDNFANAQAISGVFGNVTGRNTVASKEGGEPNHAGSPGGVSVWYQWTAPSSGNFSFNTFGSDFNTLLAVYTGNSLNTLTAVSSNDDVGGVTQSRVTFNATAGTVYYIVVDGSVGVPGNITPFSGSVALSWAPETGVSNDDFRLAQQLNGASGNLAATNAGASKETGEPNHAADHGGRSVWYSWTAPFSGPVLFTTSGSDFDTLLAVYTGSSINQLTQVASNDDSPYTNNLGHILSSSLSFTATAGTVYRIAVDGSGGRFGNIALRWGPDAQISGHVSFLGGVCGSDKKVTMLLSGEDARAVTFTGSGSYTFQHLRVGGNYSIRGVSEISASCLPLFLERAQNAFPLAGDVLDANFVDDGLRGGGSTSNITGHVQNAANIGLYNVAVALSGTAERTVYTDNAGLYLLPNLPAGTYQVTPSKAGVVFTPASLEFTFTTGRTITDADFKTQDSFNLSGQTKDQNNDPVSGVTVTISGDKQQGTTQSDANGYYAFDAAAGGSYTLTAAKAGLSFTPPAQTTGTLNTNQKNLDFVTQQTQTETRTLTVASANPNTAVNVTVSPADKNNLANGATQFTRTYELNTTINLTAPATAGTNVFQKWLKDGADYATSAATSVLLDANHTMTAVYLTTTAQTPAGQNVSVELNGVKVTFATVTGPGTTTITPINAAATGQLPNAYQLTGDSMAFDIASSATVQPPISVCFNLPFITDANVFAQLRLLHNENGVLVDRTSIQDFTAKQICAKVNSLSPFVLASSSLPLLQLLLEESAAPSTQAAALDAVLLLRDPFPVMNLDPLYPATDRNTRVLLFVKNLQLQAGETAAAVTVNLVDSSGHSHDVVAEGLWTMPSLEFSQVTFRLPDGLSPGACTLQIKAHAQVSNVGVIHIKM